MDTTRSTRMVQEFLARGHPFKRKVQTYTKHFGFGPDIVFPQLCPAREADWIEGWEADLIYTTTGYVEPGCVFTTPESNSQGAGLWIVTRLEPDRVMAWVTVQSNSVVEHGRIDLIDNGDGTCEGIWTLTYTAINEEGNAAVEAMPDADPDFHVVPDGLERFLKTGEEAEATEPS